VGKIKNETTTNVFYVSNLPSNVSKVKIAHVFSQGNTVLSIYLPNPVLHASGGYAIVEMFKRTNIETTLSRLKDVTIDGYKIFVTTDKAYTETRNNLARFFSGNTRERLEAADELLAYLLNHLPESTSVIYSKKFLSKLNLSMKTRKTISKTILIEIATDLLSEKRKAHKKKEKSSSSVYAILIPMGGQPPKR
jgi:hypothetical protein